MTLRISVCDDGRGYINRVTGRPGRICVRPMADADSIPDLQQAVWDLFHDGKITREEREQLHADIDAECGL